MGKVGYSYILASKPNGVLYIGVTSNLLKRIYEHREGLVEGFSKKYHVKHLVHYEIYDDIADAILREKRLKNWKRGMKIDLIERHNPHWTDLYPTLL